MGYGYQFFEWDPGFEINENMENENESSESHQDKSRFRVINTPYEIHDTEHNTT